MQSARAGSGSFGTKAVRKEGSYLQITGEGGPGPGAYRAEKVSKSDKAKMPSSSFKSKVAQRGKTKNSDTPGAYVPNMAAIERDATNSAVHMKARSERFAAAKQNNSELVVRTSLCQNFMQCDCECVSIDL